MKKLICVLLCLSFVMVKVGALNSLVISDLSDKADEGQVEARFPLDWIFCQEEQNRPIQ